MIGQYVPARSMSRQRHLAALVIVGLALGGPAGAADVQVCFTPGENCTDRIVAVLDGAKRSLLVQQYELTNRTLIQAILRAHRRGVAVRVVLDRDEDSPRHSGADALVKGGVPVLVDDRIAGIAHNKVAVVDDAVVVGGSFNWTYAAQSKNAENVLMIEDHALAGRFAANFERRAAVSTPYRGRGTEE